MNSSRFYKLTSSYIRTNRNFAILNLPEIGEGETSLQRAAKIYNNVLCRGHCVNPSAFLRKEFWGSEDIVDPSEKTKPTFLVSTEMPRWHLAYLNDSPPALEFINEILPDALGDWSWVVQLIRAEVAFSTIFNREMDDFVNQQVDFFIPYINVVVEVDGIDHEKEVYNDLRRDKAFNEHDVDVIRIKTDDIRTKSKRLFDAIAVIKQKCESEPILSGHYKPIADKLAAQNAESKWLEELIIPTLVLRLQHLLLQLVIRGEFEKSQQHWTVTLAMDSEFMGLGLTAYHERIVSLAVIDLQQSLNCISVLIDGQEIDNEFDVALVRRSELNRSSSSTLQIDLGLNKWDSEDLECEGSIVCRSDAFDTYAVPKNQGKWKTRDYYRTFPVAELNLAFDEEGDGDLQGDALEHLLNDIFGYAKFNDGQLPIIKNVLSGEDTIGILPTGRGKSICYQLPGILKGGTTIVICPIKALMRDQKEDLHRVGITRASVLNSELTPEEREELLDELNSGKCRFLFISPEQMQKQPIRELVRNASAQERLGYVVIDEAHCLSEWGHDFRVSYLNLENAFQSEAKHTQYIILTATASLAVLQDIQTEFKIDDYNLRTLEDYGRPELRFIVKEAKNDKYTTLSNFIAKLQAESAYPFDSNPEAGAGIIFTPFVNGAHGCWDLANKITNDSNLRNLIARSFSGSKPKKFGHESLGWEDYKVATQTEFKDKRFSVLAATKAFGMGVNMKNTRFTVHYGIPSSIEALYQEAGRAGRDGKTAICLIILTDEEDDCGILNQRRLSQEELRVFLEAKKFGAQKDLRRQLFLMASEDDSVLSNYRFLYRAYHLAKQAYEADEIIKAADFDDLGRQFGTRDLRQKVEKMIYRLRQLGIVKDWVVEGNWMQSCFRLTFGSFDLKDIEEAFIETLSKYEIDFNAEQLFREVQDEFGDELPSTEFICYELLLLAILRWVENHFLYQRRQQLFNVLQICKDYDEIGSTEFRERLENYFKITTETQVLQAIADGGLDSLNLVYQVLVYEPGEDARLKSPKSLKTMADGLIRFLESYQNNAGLNLLAGLLQAYNTNQISAINLERVKSSFKTQRENGIEPLDALLEFAQTLPIDSRAPLALLTNEMDLSYEDILRVSDILQCHRACDRYLNAVGDRLSRINNRIKRHAGK